MEVYILDSLNRRIEVIDDFVSLIWTERFNSKGDFEMKVNTSLGNRNRLVIGTRLAMNDSYRVMTIESVEDATDDDGNQIMTVKGPTLERIFEHRLAMGSLSGTDANPKWIITGYPKDLANKLFHDICVTGVVNTGDIITGVTEESLFIGDTIAAPSVSITYEIVPPATLYDALKKLCEVYSMGFRLVREPITNGLYFDVYMGHDRTTQQSTMSCVVFSEGLENLSNTRKLTTSTSYKNVAYVISPVGAEIVLADNVDPSVTGFERKVLVVNATDITDTVPADATAKMIQRGKEELAKNSNLMAFDGEMPKNGSYIYGFHYDLGDLVEVQDTDGATSVMQVTEQIFVSDKEGERNYPTLSVNSFITPGSWLSWDYGQVWSDLGDTEYWADQP
jgi:hypothetical protein